MFSQSNSVREGNVHHPSSRVVRITRDDLHDDLEGEGVSDGERGQRLLSFACLSGERMCSQMLARIIGTDEMSVRCD